MKTGSGSSLAAGGVSSGADVFSTRATARSKRVSGAGISFSAHLVTPRERVPGSGSAFRLVVTKLEGNSPTPLWFSPFHQLESLGG